VISVPLWWIFWRQQGCNCGH